MKWAITICTIILFLSSSQLLAQDSSYIASFSGTFEQSELSAKEKWGVKSSSNEFQLLFSGLFYTYKELLSSQDNSVCQFHPSCSVYAIRSIQKKGALVGILAAFDRLLRCNGNNKKDYEINREKQLLDDPVF